MCNNKPIFVSLKTFLRTNYFCISTKANQTKKINEQDNLIQRKIRSKRISSAHDFRVSRPLFLSATPGDSEGEIKLAWEPVKKAHTYVVQKSKGSESPSKWMNEDIVTKSNCTVTKLKSRHQYWFRVAAVGLRGQGSWSKFVHRKAP